VIVGRSIRIGTAPIMKTSAHTDPKRRSSLLLSSLIEEILANSRVTPGYIADHIRRVLKDGGSAPHSEDVQRFFKDEVQSRGWYTAELRKFAVRFRRSILRERGMEFLEQVADHLFSGRILEEKVMAVFLLEKQTEKFGDKEFELFTSWIDRITSWADHDALAHYLLAPMVAAEPSRCRQIFEWAKSENRWRRRAACVALIRGARERRFLRDIVRLSNRLLQDEDDMVRKGLGWLLRETVKADPVSTVPYLMKIRKKAPRLVLRTACETLPILTRKQVLA
jgi:3-methyladenine DNA glycosylase AlkD